MLHPRSLYRFRKFGLLLVLPLICLFLLGCEPVACSTCNQCPTGVELESERVCDDDFNSEADYQQAIDLAISFGCTCTSE